METSRTHTGAREQGQYRTRKRMGITIAGCETRKVDLNSTSRPIRIPRSAIRNGVTLRLRGRY